MQTNCLKCSYLKGGERICQKCGRPWHIPKGEWGVPKMEVLSETGITLIEEDFLTGETLVGAPASPSPSADAGPAPSSVVLPPHSRLGASSAKRWMNCSGSPALISQIKIVDEVDPDYRAEGTQAHELASHCLDNEIDAWEALGNYPLLKFEDVGCVQEYLDYVRSRPGRRDVEIRMHRPELHELFYGTIDCALVPVTGQHGLVLEIVDFKFGQGVYVSAERNEQLMYYALGYIMDDPDFFPNDGVVRLTISQPRMTWADTIRSWNTTIGELKRWLYEELLPAMRRQADELVFSLGSWCQFCPAKLVCPAMSEAYRVFQGQPVEALTTMTDEALGERYVLSASVRQYLTALQNEVHRRLMGRGTVPGAKLVRQRTDRAWKEGAEEAAMPIYGPDRLTVPKMLSPAVMEKLPGGKEFVAEWAFTPEGGFTVALEDDPRKGVERPLASEVFSRIAVDSEPQNVI